MAEPLKNMYDPEFFEYLCNVLGDTVPKFNDTKFIHSIFDTEWPDLELKQRTRKVTMALHRMLPDDFESAVKYLVNIAHAYLQSKYTKPTYPLIFLPDYIEMYGLGNFNASVNALEQITPLASAEFAIRPFIIRHPDKTMKIMKRWSKHENHHVRRLSSEGCRPRLPWAMGLPDFKKDPSPIIPILENLKKDKSEYVRRSVANNLNDIAKDHPEIVLQIAERWKEASPETNWILKHGSRTLLKKGLSQALTFHGYDPGLKTGVEKLSLGKGKIKIGDSATFEFCAVNKEKMGANIRLEYAITFLTSTGKASRKVFKIAEDKFKPGEKKYFTRKQRFTDFTTRKLYPGKHKLEIVVNGTPKSSIDFFLQN